MRKLRVLLKVLNPIIWCINVFNYWGYLEMRHRPGTYERYDFSRDLKYF